MSTPNDPPAHPTTEETTPTDAPHAMTSEEAIPVLSSLLDETAMLYDQESQDVDRERVVALDVAIDALRSHEALIEALQGLVGLAEKRGKLHEYTAALDVARAALQKAGVTK